MAEVPIAVEIFCSYAHEDEPWLRKLETHLRLLKRQGLITLWHDRLITPGTNWARIIDTHLETASIILLLVSADFFVSDYCYGIEMKRALERQEAGEARVIPILVRPANWTDAPFASLQFLPTDAKPITSWRNKDTALADVTAGIRRVIVEELPLLAASAPRAALPAIWNIPYPRNPFFLGRESELAQLRCHLQAGQSTALSQPQAISGLGGIGKTQLALEYAYRYHQDYEAVLWAHAESPEALVSSYVAIASHLRLSEREAKEQEITVRAVKTWLQTHSGWLLILDNADELALLPNFLPPSLGGHLLLTTRAAATGRLAHRMEVETLLPEDGALFVLRRAALILPDAELSQVSQDEQELALQISQELGGLPLALDQVGAYLEETGMDLGSYWHIYQQHRAELLRQRRGVIADHPAPVATTWSLSFQKIKEKNPAAADLLCLCAYLSPDAIPEEIFSTCAPLLGSVLAQVAADAFLLNQALEALRAYSLVRRDAKKKIFSVHRLVQVVLQDALGETERHLWAERAVHAVNANFPRARHATWLQCERLLQHALQAAYSIERNHIIGKEAGRLLRETGIYLQDRARYTEAELFYQKALYLREKALGLDHPDVAYLLNNLATLYKEQGRYADAELLYQKVLHIREKSLRPGHLDVAYSLNNLADLYRQQGKYVEAEPFYLRALCIEEQQLGSEHPNIAYPLNNLATLYRQQGKYTDAELLYQRALHIREKALGLDHPDVAYPLDHLATLYKEQGRYVDAELFYQKALRIREDAQGSEHPDVAKPLNNLATLYHEQGKYADAEPLYQRALRIQEQQLGLEHPDVAYPLNHLATLYRQQGKYTDAEPLYQRALHIREQQLGPEHPETVETMHDLAQFREIQGKREEARIWYIRVLAVREQVLGAHHPKTMETRMLLIALLHALGQYGQAAQLR